MCNVFFQSLACLDSVCGRRYLDIYSEAALRGLVFILLSPDIGQHCSTQDRVMLRLAGGDERSRGW